MAYGILFTGTGIASLLMIGLVLSPLGDNYIMLFFFFSLCSVAALLILVFMFEQKRFEPDWSLILEDTTN